MKKPEHEPRLSEPDLPQELEEFSALADRDDLLQCRVTGLSDQVSAVHATLTECRLEHLDLGRLDLTAAALVDCEWRDTRITTLAARDASLRRVRLRGGRIATLDLGNARIDSLELTDLHIGYLNLADAIVEDSVIRDCRIDTLDVPVATVKRVRVEGTMVTELDTRGLTAAHFDLHTAELGSVTDVAGLRGCLLTADQLVALHVKLAQYLGITLA